MKLYIPEIGDHLVLEKDWTFTLQGEYRNQAAWQHWTGKEVPSRSYRSPDPEMKMTLPIGTVLKVDRVYIRKGASDYSSITFYSQSPGEKKKQRFWVKLKEANTIEFTKQEKEEIV